jgi:hypothetical protein
MVFTAIEGRRSRLVRERPNDDNQNQPARTRARIDHNLSLNSSIYPLAPTSRKLSIKRDVRRSLLDEYLKEKWPIRYMANYLRHLQMSLENLVPRVLENTGLLGSLIGPSNSFQDILPLIKEDHREARYLRNVLKMINNNQIYQTFGFRDFYGRLDDASKENVQQTLKSFVTLAIGNSLPKSEKEQLLFDNRPSPNSRDQRNSPNRLTSVFNNIPYPNNIFGANNLEPHGWSISFEN